MVTAASKPEDLAELYELLRTAGVATVGEGGHAWIIADLRQRERVRDSRGLGGADFMGLSVSLEA